MKRSGTKTACPRCRGKLVYDGAGLSCIACEYKIRIPKKRKPRK